MMDLVKGELGIVHCACTEVYCEHKVLARVCSRVNCSQQFWLREDLAPVPAAAWRSGRRSIGCTSTLRIEHQSSTGADSNHISQNKIKSGFHQTGAIGHTSVKIQDTLHPAWLDRQTFFSEQLLL